MKTIPQELLQSILQYAGELVYTPGAEKYLLLGCLVPVPQGVTPAALSQPKAPKKRSRPSTPNPAPAKEPLLETFIRKKGLTDHHLTLLFSTLQKEGWIAENSNPDDFLSLFDGKPTDCKVIWNPSVGKGILRDLFQMMVDGHFIAPPPGFGYLRIIESHFIYPNGQYVQGLKGGYTSRKAKATIDTCRNILLINPRAKDFRSMKSEIEDEFSDIRYTPFE